MKILLLCWSLLVAVSSWGSMIPVTNTSPNLVKDYASGICSIGTNEEGTKCCTGFRIDKDLIMTNFHCLACVHKIFNTLVKKTPRFMEPSQFLYSLPHGDPVFLELVKEEMRASGLNMDYDQFFLPANDTEFRKLMNSYPELLTRINFKNTIDNAIPLIESSYQIKEIVAMNLSLDYSVIRVEKMGTEEKILKLNSQVLVPKQKLAIMGHPSVGPYPNKKVYDVSSDCQVLDPTYDTSNVRIHVFTHHCSTAPGSSGSPIVDRANGKVIGIHWGANDSEDVRFGIEMKSIIRDLQEAWQVIVKKRK